MEARQEQNLRKAATRIRDVVKELDDMVMYDILFHKHDAASEKRRRDLDRLTLKLQIAEAQIKLTLPPE